MSRSLRVERCTSWVPNRASSRATSLLTAEGVMPRLRAAAEKPPRSTTCTKASISPERLTSMRGMAMGLQFSDFNSQMCVRNPF